MELDLSNDDLEVLIEIRRAGAFRTCEDAIRGALFWYARFLDVPVPAGAFALAVSALARAHLAPFEGEAEAEPASDQGELFGEGEA